MSEATGDELGVLIGFRIDGLVLVEIWTRRECLWPCEDPMDMASRMEELTAQIQEDTLGLSRPFL
jgi:hypothetical protein